MRIDKTIKGEVFPFYVYYIPNTMTFSVRAFLSEETITCKISDDLKWIILPDDYMSPYITGVGRVPVKKLKIEKSQQREIKESLEEKPSLNPKQKLGIRINLFLDKYAGLNANWDPEFDEENEKYSSPDASTLKYCADVLALNMTPHDYNSSWESGGYEPYTSKEGREEHNAIINELKQLKNGL